MTTVPTPVDSSPDPLAELRTADPATYAVLNELARAHLAAEPKAFAEAYVRATMQPQEAGEVLEAISGAMLVHAMVVDHCKVAKRLAEALPAVDMTGDQALAVWDANGSVVLQDILLSAAAHISEATGSDGPQRSHETVVELAHAAGRSLLAEIAAGAA